MKMIIPEPERKAIEQIAADVSQAGGRALLVGGAVRDMFSGTTSKDFDLEIFGVEPACLTELLERHFAIDTVGVSFGVIKLHHLDIDVSLPRRESKCGTGHRAFEIFSDAGLTVKEAARRRDFTINALYYDPLTEEVLDPYGGVADLKAKVLRHVSDAFAEDPLRVLRGMQFVARFELTPAPETIALCQSIVPEGLAPERQFEEWGKLLVKGVCISRGLQFLRETGWVKYYPELQALIGCRQEPKWHPEGDVWNHTCLCLDSFASKRTGEAQEDLIVGLAVLCHDFGKPATTRLENGYLRSLGHDVAGVAPTLAFLRRLTNEERVLKEVVPLVSQHMQPYALWKGDAGDAAIRRLALRVGRIDRLIRVVNADATGRLDVSQDQSETALKWLAAAAERLRIASSAPRPIVQGRDLINLGFRPSPEFGEVLGLCFQAQLDGEFVDLDGGVEFLSRMPELSLLKRGAGEK